MRARKFGLDHAIELSGEAFPETDVIIDFIGASYLQRNIESLRRWAGSYPFRP